MIDKIFLFITFIGMVAGISMLIMPDDKKNNIFFFMTCIINTFFSVLNLTRVTRNDYVSLVFSLFIIFFALGGIILRFLPIKQSALSPFIVFITMIISIFSVFGI